MITLITRGDQETLPFLESLIAGLESGEGWDPILSEMMEEARQYAASISPVITGSYRRSHQVTIGNMMATLSIDPAARNTETGTPVSGYAGPVEERHQVYEHTAARLPAIIRGRAGELLGGFVE